ncbi:HipA N-terminal domain-containing protein [Methanimicrococcus blatticola]|uniref:Serine/threonine-protein kinase HipA n=1 Tax=Methanimicrococcus blatticola TaxID=91560 RepID=A0A484F5E2_9EURY|nr:HipA N-terminal domain-containing protein [Methanimicrococcus blatticola]MBZ3936035.1 HipA N-terminal domain-containing protein [Methanimicrococcus blatticola]MCC2509353.1 HipA N-terminal domain-containing protein [Methanimicrococcus blatticola]TDQ68236.1 serine/threonine-protein kinase HipA [Methanimicrococcus blatticola]
MKQAEIFTSDLSAGILTENEDGFFFRYHEEYLQNEKAEPISLTLPLQEMPFKSDRLFPFFDGLIPEGWLLDIAETNWKISSRDRMSLLLACCRNCIGTVSVIPIENDNEEE